MLTVTAGTYDFTDFKITIEFERSGCTDHGCGRTGDFINGFTLKLESGKN